MKRTDYRPNTASSSSRPVSMPVRPKREVVNRFLSGEGGKTGNESLSSDGKILKSYDTAIAIRQSDGTILVNNTKYSSTTSSQQNYLISELKRSGQKYEVTGGKDRGYKGEDFSDEFEQHNDVVSSKNQHTGRMTLSQIKSNNKDYFFSPDTMRLYRKVDAKYRVRYDESTDTNYVIVNRKEYPESNKRKDVVYKYNAQDGTLTLQD